MRKLNIQFKKMQKLGKNDSGICSAQMESPLIADCLSWDNSTESHVQQSSLSNSLSLKMGVPAKHCHNAKQLTFQFHDQDSSSTQSTGQSHSEVASMKESNLYGQGIISSHSESNGIQGKLVGGHIKTTTSMGTQDFVFPSQLDYSQAIARIPFQYAEPIFSGLMAAPFGPQSMIHNPQMIGVTSARVPLPVDMAEHEPIYVNAKQFQAIIRRRQYRAKLEAQNKHVKNRKPYLHESRHLHALKRARGSGGRFLNTKNQQSKPTRTKHGLDCSGFAQLHLSGNVSEPEVHQHEIYRDGSFTTSCSEVASASNSDNIFRQQPDFRFSGYPVHIGGTIQTHLMGMRGDVNHHLSTL